MSNAQPKIRSVGDAPTDSHAARATVSDSTTFAGEVTSIGSLIDEVTLELSSLNRRLEEVTVQETTVLERIARAIGLPNASAPPRLDPSVEEVVSRTVWGPVAEELVVRLIAPLLSTGTNAPRSHSEVLALWEADDASALSEATGLTPALARLASGVASHVIDEKLANGIVVKKHQKDYELCWNGKVLDVRLQADRSDVNSPSADAGSLAPSRSSERSRG